MSESPEQGRRSALQSVAGLALCALTAKLTPAVAADDIPPPPSAPEPGKPDRKSVV